MREGEGGCTEAPCSLLTETIRGKGLKGSEVLVPRQLTSHPALTGLCGAGERIRRVGRGGGHGRKRCCPINQSGSTNHTQPERAGLAVSQPTQSCRGSSLYLLAPSRGFDKSCLPHTPPPPSLIAREREKEREPLQTRSSRQFVSLSFRGFHRWLGEEGPGKSTPLSGAIQPSEHDRGD